jgi:hypothetical protein
MNHIPFLDLLSNHSKMQQYQNDTKENKQSTQDQPLNESESNIPLDDDNEEILRLLKARLQLGRDRYGHGMIVDDDTTKYGTRTNDWHLMAEEEVLDGLIYAAASIIRYRRMREMVNKNKTMDDFNIQY